MSWWTLNWWILMGGFLLLYLSLSLAGLDRHATPQQVADSDRPQDYAFTEHPMGVIDAALVILVAWLEPRYDFNWSWPWGFATDALSLLIVGVALESWRRLQVEVGDHASYGGKITGAGILHGIFFYAMVRVFAQVALGLTTPTVSIPHLLGLAIFFTAFFPLGVIKFSERWRWDRTAKVQVSALIGLVWGVMGTHLYLRNEQNLLFQLAIAAGIVGSMFLGVRQGWLRYPPHP